MVNRQNYLRAKAFLGYQAAIRQLRESSIRRYWSYLKHLLLWADEIPLWQVTNIRPSFPDYLKALSQERAQGPMARDTLKKIIHTAQRLFVWLKGKYPRDFRSLPTIWIDSLQPPRSTPPDPVHQFLTLSEVLKLCSIEIPEYDLATRRDQAAAAMLFLSGMRGGAFCSVTLACIDLPNCQVKQWPSLGVHTKYDKSATTYLLEIPKLISVVKSWDQFIRSQLPMTAIWYTPTRHKWGEQRLFDGPPGANRNVALAKRLRRLFNAADLPYKSPHKFRHGHAVYGLQHARTMADYKAVSMNLMHTNIQVTDGIYAPLLDREVKKRIGSLNRPSAGQPSDHLEKYFNKLSDTELSKALMIIAGRLAQ